MHFVPDDPMQGSSLRAQGSHARRSDDLAARGFIPACAGEPEDWQRVTDNFRVHPCVRRGADPPPSSPAECEGSSLRAQGSLLTTPQAFTRTGFIPACAGEPGFRSDQGPIVRVHPCVRRGAAVMRSLCRANEGSSLRAQGSPTRRLILHVRIGFIPACAGEPPAADLSQGRDGVHPCVRRGASDCPHHAGRRPGSSLRAQGSPIEQLIDS